MAKWKAASVLVLALAAGCATPPLQTQRWSEIETWTPQRLHAEYNRVDAYYCTFNCAEKADYLAGLRRVIYVAEHPTDAQEVRDAVLRGEVHAGMPPGAVEASWGLPKFVESNGARWVYAWPFMPRRYVMFQDGVVTLVQDGN